MPELPQLKFYKTKHSRMRRLWHILISVLLFLLAAIATAYVVWLEWFRDPVSL